VHDSWYVVCLSNAIKEGPTHADKERRELSIQPLPCTSSDKGIKKAHSIREALRKLLLDRREPDVAVDSAVSAD